MKKGIHPDYRDLVFHDLSSDYKFLTRSTVQTKDSIEFEGKTYPLVKIEVSSQSHPFYTAEFVHRVLCAQRLTGFKELSASNSEHVKEAIRLHAHRGKNGFRQYVVLVRVIGSLGDSWKPSAR